MVVSYVKMPTKAAAILESMPKVVIHISQDKKNLLTFHFVFA
jgi:hypothetical protein